MGPAAVSLYRAGDVGGGDPVVLVKKIPFPTRRSDGVLDLVPRPGLVLVYLYRRLLFALPGAEWALRDGLQFGMSAGSVRVESIQVLDPSKD